MAVPKIVFLTYLLETSPITGGTRPYAANKTYGYSTAIHCNYIQQIQTEDITNKKINFTFTENNFPFMKPASKINTGFNGHGWTAYRIKALVQVVDWTGSTSASTENFRPAADAWKYVDVTDQIVGYVANQAINPTGLTQTLFEIDPTLVSSYPSYRLTYLNYPTALTGDTSKLAFGEEVFFYGTVGTDIESISYTMGVAVTLPLNDFNYSENPTWDGVSAVFITEIGIFDENNQLVAIGKLNSPVDKDSSRFRSFAFDIDF